MPPAPERVALITGGAIRIGKAIVQKLSQTHRVVIHYHRSEKEGRALLDTLQQNGITAILQEADLCIPSHCTALIANTIEAFGRLDILVNNAGLWCDDSADLMQLARMKSLNLDAPLRLIDAALPHLTTTKGSVVNISDVAGISPFRQSVAYSKTRAAFLAKAQQQVLPLAALGIRINAICPGTIAFAPHLDTAARHRILAGIPLQKTGTPAEVAALVSFLAYADFVIGQVIAVDGGRLSQIAQNERDTGIKK